MADTTQRRVRIGSYTDGEARAGIFTALYDAAARRLHVVRADGSVPNPSFLTCGNGRLYAAHELDDRSCMAVYAEGDDGALVCRGVCGEPTEAGTCFVEASVDGRRLYGANYESGSISCCTLTQDGRPSGGLPAVHDEGSSAHPERQRSAHVHSIRFVPGTNVLAAVDLGIDAIALYRADASGALEVPPAASVATPPGSGPRMLAFHPRLRLAALVDELACDVAFYEFDRTGTRWRCVDRQLLPVAGATEEALAAHPAFSPDGRRLYVSVRGSDRIALFALDDDGRVESRVDFGSGGRGPRHIALDPLGSLLAVANVASDDACVFELDPLTGEPRSEAHADVPRAACVVWE